MTTFTRERLIEHAQNHIAHDAWMKDKFGETYKTPATVELARIALASLTAKPIAHTSQHGIDRMVRDNAGLLAQRHGGNAYEIPLYATPPAPDNKQVDELAMWIKRLAHSLKYANQLSKLPGDAMEYLSRKGLISVEDVLRAPPFSALENQRKDEQC